MLVPLDLKESLVPRESLAQLELRDPPDLPERREREALAVSLVVLAQLDNLEAVVLLVLVDSLVLMDLVAPREALVSVVPLALWVPRDQLASPDVLESLVCLVPRV